MLTQQQIYASFNVFANLANKADVIEVVAAQSIQGFDPSWLRNTVIEPLERRRVSRLRRNRDG